MTIMDYCKLVLSQPFFRFALTVSVAVFVIGIILNLVAKHKKDSSTFSGSLYDLILLGIEAAIIFCLSLMVKSDSLLSDSFTNLPLIGVIPNPADIAQIIIQRNLLGMASVGGRIWLQGLMIDLFTKMFLDMYPTKSFFRHYLRVGIIVIPTVLLNIFLNLFLEECVSFSSDYIFAGVFIFGMIITVIFAILWLIKKKLSVVGGIFFMVGYTVFWTFVLGYIWGTWYSNLPEYNITSLEGYESLIVLFGILAFAFLVLMHLLYVLLKKPDENDNVLGKILGF